MANTKISSLTSGGAVAATDIFPSVETAGVGPVTKTAAQLKTFTNVVTIDSTPITGGTAGRLLFESATNKVSENAGLTFNSTTGVLTVASIAGAVQPFLVNNLGIT